MIKFLKISAVIISAILIAVLGAYLTYSIITRDARLYPEKLIGAGKKITVYDDNDNEIAVAALDLKHSGVEIEKLSPQTVNAFIASEDRTFFKHHGLNYKRILKAMYKNITSGSFKEGASTISQQLIKNTHLSNDKTIKRKLKEIKLTKKLENRYSKQDILEMYLNTIYFGHNCYGLQSAANFYFDKRAEDLTVTESATIVGLLTSPNNYSPFKNPQKCLQRRNTVLKSMLECKFIDNAEYEKYSAQPLEAKKTTKNAANADYVNAVLEELDGLNINHYALDDGCVIKTYLNADLQKFIEGLDYPCDNGVIVTDHFSGGVNAYKSTIGGARRQPASTVKPILVYAPAIDERLISPFTKISDEKIDFGGYKPENHDKKYHGNVTVAESIKNSYNIPAVKTLNSLTLDKVKKYAAAMNIALDDDECNLSLALGGMKYGLSLKEIADRYSVFPKGGKYSPSRFIKEIKNKDGKTIYDAHNSESAVFSAGACSLINDMLVETSKSGTAKKLSGLKFDVATKTGTAGDADGNTDAYAISYTSEKTFGVWLGDKNNKKLKITGGGDGCKIMKLILENMYSKNAPAPLDTATGTKELEIDREEYANNDKILISDPAAPKINKLKIKVLSDFGPVKSSTRFSHPTIQNPTIEVKNNAVNIELCQTKYYSYLINRAKNGKNELIYDGGWVNSVTDEPPEGSYVYSVTPYYFDGKTRHLGEKILLPQINLSASQNSPQIKIPDIAYKDWYNR